MASIEKRRRSDGRTSWRAHYRTSSGQQRNKTFDRRADAERFLASVENSRIAGTFVDPALSRLAVGEWTKSGFKARPTSSPRRMSATPV